MIQKRIPPVPEVGNQCKVTEKKRIAVIATQKSGALAPTSANVLPMRSNKPPGRYAASAPTKTASEMPISRVTPASFSVVG
jgi:hypothetical protein